VNVREFVAWGRAMHELSHNGTTYTWWLHEPDMITVRAPDGCTKTTQVGGSANAPQSLARIMARELEDDLANDANKAKPNIPVVGRKSPEDGGNDV
jgi:hypothetical protein